MFTPPPSPSKQRPDAPTKWESRRTTRTRTLLATFALVVIAASSRYVTRLDSLLNHSNQPTAMEDLISGLLIEKRANTGTPPGVAPPIPDPPFPVPNPFPQPFDVSLSYNFTSSTCIAFFQNFTSSPSFRSCRPLSLLLSSSNAFYDAQSNLTQITAILGGTCDTPLPLDQCESNMAGFATQIQSACSQDLMSRNPIVWEAFNGFQSYSMYRKAGCLRNLRSNTYCYADSLTPSSANDLYFYNIGIGTALPRSSIPTCSACIQTLMTIYASYATNSKLLISETYPQAYSLASKTCGANYAKPAGAKASSAQSDRIKNWSSTAAVVVTFSLISFWAS